MKNYNKTLTFLTALSLVLLILGAGIFSFARFHRTALPVPEKVSFGVWYPSPQKTQYKLVKGSLEYDQSAENLSFVMRVDGSKQSLTFNQQAVPDSVSGLPDLFDAQLKSLPEVAKFDSINGPVSITHPTATEQATAIMRSKGTLLLVHSDTQMSIESWRILFNDMEIKA